MRWSQTLLYIYERENKRENDNSLEARDYIIVINDVVTMGYKLYISHPMNRLIFFLVAMFFVSIIIFIVVNELLHHINKAH